MVFVLQEHCSYDKVDMLEESGILYDGIVFENVARTGHHPRMSASFNEDRYQRLEKRKESDMWRCLKFR